MAKYRLKIDLPEIPGDVKAEDILTTKTNSHGTYLMKGDQPICHSQSFLAKTHCELIEEEDEYVEAD